MTLEERELDIIKANARKSVNEINQTSMAESAQIAAEAALKDEQIKGETLVVKYRDTILGQCEANKIRVQAKNKCSLEISAKMLEIADLKAQTLKVTGEGEAQIAEVMASRRKYEQLYAQCDVIKKMQKNGNLKIFGDN